MPPEAGDRASQRVFLGIAVPASVANYLVTALAPLQEALPDARWVPAPSLHLTLAFLGEVPTEAMPAVTHAACGAAAACLPFELRTGRAGGNARLGRPGVAWLDVDHGAERVSALTRELADRLHAEGLWQPRDRRSHRPHLTVARRATPELIDVLRAVTGIRAGWTVDGMTVFRSHLGPEGSRYEALALARLGVEAGQTPGNRESGPVPGGGTDPPGSHLPE